MRNLLTTLLFLVAAISSWWLYRQMQPSGTVAPAQTTHEPDYFFEDFVATSMNAQGQPKQRLRGTRMAHFPDDDTTEIEHPMLELYTESMPVWRINAEHGWISPGGDQVQLRGEVNIQRHAEQEQDVIYVQTRDVLIKPDDEYVETDQPVTITRGGVSIRAVGMRAYTGQGRVELRAEVKGVHVPD